MATAPAPGILSVSALTRLIKERLSESFSAIWVRGEITGCKRADKGHLYFGLKDRMALIECVVWKSSVPRLTFEPRDGMEVEAFGAISLYEPRGRYQLTVESMRPAGLGALLLALEERKRKLAAEGLFDVARKRPLPRYPRRIGLVTSPVGAAVRDLVSVLRARWPSIEIVLAAVAVQGPAAASQIASAIQRFQVSGRVELIIVGRGGGSLEDLWAFNDENVVRTIAASRIPVVSAVGHEVDQTLSDLVADVRAATPSHAAQIVVPVRSEVQARVRTLEARMHRALAQIVLDRRGRVRALVQKYGFRRRHDAIGMWQRRVDDLLDRFTAHVHARLAQARARVASVRDRYGMREWPRRLTEHRRHVAEVAAGLATAVRSGLDARRRRLAAAEDRLRALSPRRVLERGYCLVRSADGRLLRVAAELAAGEAITIEFARGEADARVETVRPGGSS